MMQNNFENTKEIKEFIVVPASYEIQMPICDKTVSSDVSGDFILPDYLPEIKRLLHVAPSIREVSKYLSAGGAEFAGCIDYNLLYTDNDGKLFSASLSSDYDFDCKLADGAANIGSESVFCDTDIESVSCRPVGPRKLVIKSRLHSRVRAFDIGSIPEHIEGAVTAEDEFSLERLRRVYPTAYIARARGEEHLVREEITLDASEKNTHVVFSEGIVAVSDASCVDGGISCRAEIILRVVLEGEDGELHTVSKRFPVSETISLDDAQRGCECRAWGSCGTIGVNIENSDGDDRAILACEISATLEAQLCKNISVTLSEDAYSTLYDCECTYKEREMPYLIKAQNGTLTLGNSVPISEVGIPLGAVVTYASGAAKVEKVDTSKGKHIISGVCAVSLLLSDDQLESVEFDIPWMYEIEGAGDEAKSFEGSANVISMRARVEGENVALDAELTLSLAIYGDNKVRALDTVKLDKSTPYAQSGHGAAFVICYPHSGESLWEIAKRYHTPLARLSHSGAGENSNLDAASAASLSGNDFIIFEN